MKNSLNEGNYNFFYFDNGNGKGLLSVIKKNVRGGIKSREAKLFLFDSKYKCLKHKDKGGVLNLSSLFHFDNNHLSVVFLSDMLESFINQNTCLVCNRKNKSN